MDWQVSLARTARYGGAARLPPLSFSLPPGFRYAHPAGSSARAGSSLARSAPVSGSAGDRRAAAEGAAPGAGDPAVGPAPQPAATGAAAAAIARKQAPARDVCAGPRSLIRVLLPPGRALRPVL